jgi:chromosome segregation ATPase
MTEETISMSQCPSPPLPPAPPSSPSYENLNTPLQDENKENEDPDSFLDFLNSELCPLECSAPVPTMPTIVSPSSFSLPTSSSSNDFIDLITVFPTNEQETQNAIFEELDQRIEWERKNIQEYNELLAKQKKLREQLVKSTCKIRQYEMDNQNLQATIQSLSAINKSLNMDNASLNKTYEELKSSFKTSKSLENQYSELKSKEKFLISSNEALKTSLVKLSGENDALGQQVLALKKEVRKEQTTRKNLARSRENIANKIKILNVENQCLKSQNTELKMEKGLDKKEQELLSMSNRILELNSFRNETLRFIDSVSDNLNLLNTYIKSDEKRDTCFRRKAGQVLREDDCAKMSKNNL